MTFLECVYALLFGKPKRRPEVPDLVAYTGTPEAFWLHLDDNFPGFQISVAIEGCGKVPKISHIYDSLDRLVAVIIRWPNANYYYLAEY